MPILMVAEHGAAHRLVRDLPQHMHVPELRRHELVAYMLAVVDTWVGAYVGGRVGGRGVR